MGNPRTVLPVNRITNMVTTFDLDAFDELTREQGARLMHFRAMRCPIGMTDMYDTRKVHPDHNNCSNGFIYELAGIATCQFLSNSDSNRQQDVGQVDGSTVHVTAPRFYDGTEDPIHVVPFDRFYLDKEQISVVNWQIFEHNVLGIDKMRFPVAMVESLIDSEGNRYHQDDHFTVQNGQIVWGDKRPGFNMDEGKGIICSIRYRYRPYWYVSSLNHEIRVAQQEINGERDLERCGQSFSLQREYSFESMQTDGDNHTTDLRAQRFPGDATFGPR